MFGVQAEIAEANVYLTNKHRMRMASFSSSLAASCFMYAYKVGNRIAASLQLQSRQQLLRVYERYVYF